MRLIAGPLEDCHSAQIRSVRLGLSNLARILRMRGENENECGRSEHGCLYPQAI
jgi:hypothetical protein